jgi:hypothetical protein
MGNRRERPAQNTAIVDLTACQLSTFLMHQKNIKQTKEF